MPGRCSYGARCWLRPPIRPGRAHGPRPHRGSLAPQDRDVVPQLLQPWSQQTDNAFHAAVASRRNRVPGRCDERYPKAARTRTDRRSLAGPVHRRIIAATPVASPASDEYVERCAAARDTWATATCREWSVLAKWGGREPGRTRADRPPHDPRVPVSHRARLPPGRLRWGLERGDDRRRRSCGIRRCIVTTSAALAPGSGSESERGAFIGRLAPPFARLYHSSTDVEPVLHDVGLERLRGSLKVNDGRSSSGSASWGGSVNVMRTSKRSLGSPDASSPMTLVCSARWRRTHGPHGTSSPSQCA